MVRTVSERDRTNGSIGEGIDFQVTCGDKSQIGFLSLKDRQEAIVKGVNPYLFGPPLPGNSPVFHGREREIEEIVQALTHPGKPMNVSLLGERRIGKSSLINQVVQQLKREPVVVAYTNSLGWSDKGPRDFFTALGRAIVRVLPDSVGNEIESMDFPGFRDFLRQLDDDFRVVVVIDEFELLADPDAFNDTFFFNLRSLVDDGLPIGFFVSSRTPLKNLCEQHRIDASNFWNIFSNNFVLGLLSIKDHLALVNDPMTKSLHHDRKERSIPNYLEWAGRHPGYVQMVQRVCWNVFEKGYEPDEDRLLDGLEGHMESLWLNRSREEWEVLHMLAIGKHRNQDAALVRGLRRRGLVDDDGRIFSSLMYNVMDRHAPSGKNLKQIAEGILGGVDQVSAWYEKFEKAGIKLIQSVKKPRKETPWDDHNLDLSYPHKGLQKTSFFKFIKIKNVGCIPEFNMSFINSEGKLSPWTVLLADNGYGKTTILKCIALIFSGSGSIPYLLRHPQHWVRSGYEKATIEVGILHPDNTEQSFVLEINRDQSSVEVAKANITVLNDLEKILKRSAGYLPLFAYGCHRRLSYQKPNEKGDGALFPTSQAQRVATLFDPETPLFPIQELARDLFEEDPNRAKKLIGESLKGWLKEEVDLIDVEGKTGKLRFKTSDGDVDLQQLSGGYQVMTAWIGDLLRRLLQLNPTSDEPLKRYGVLLIDEIDLHLHPEWQRKLREILTKKLPHFQIIVATHSPLVAGTAEKGEAVHLYRDQESGRIDYWVNEDSLRGWRADQILTGPLFGLSTSRDKETEREWDEYTCIYLKEEDKRTIDEKLKLKTLAEQFDMIMATPEQNKKHRDMVKIITSCVEEKLKNKIGQKKEMRSDERDRLVKMAKDHLIKMGKR